MAKATFEEQEQAISNAVKNINYDTKEFTLELLHAKFNRPIEDGITKEITIPFYQRNFVWDDKAQSQFIESILLRLPIPALLFAEAENGVMEVIDGSQRLRTIDNFLNNKFKLKGLEKLRELKGLSFNMLSSSIKRKIRNSTIRATVLFDLEKDTLDISQDLFERLNTGGSPLTNIELLKGSKDGEFMKFIFDKCAKNKTLKEISEFTKSDKERGYQEEFLIKYFTFCDGMDLNASINDYVDNYIDEKNNTFEDGEIEDKYLAQFKDMLNFVKVNNLVDNNVRMINKKNRLLAIYIGTTLALRKDITLINSKIAINIFTDEFISNAHSSGFNKLKENVELIKNIILEK